MLETTLFPPHDLTRVASDALKSWSRCKRQFAYKYVNRLQWPSDARHFSLGRDVHKLLDYQARGLDCEPLLRQAPINVRRTWEKLMAHRTAQWPIVASEWAFHVPVRLPGSLENRAEWLTGRVDRIALDPAGEPTRVWIIDWKTGTGVPRQPEEDWQTRLYLFALLEVANTPSAADLGLCRNGPLQPEAMGFLYVEVKADTRTPVREVAIPYSRERHEETRRHLEETLLAMSTEEAYALPAQCPDRFCAYRPICGIDALASV
jgi:hypothetical protein